MKKIVILVDQLHSHGGIEKLVAIKASYWADVFGFQVTILATEQVGKAIIYPISKKVTFIDLAINYNRNKSYFSIQNLLKLFKNIIKVQKILREGKIDFAIVASHIPITYLLPFIPTKTKKIKEFHFSRIIKTGSFSDKFMDYIESKYDSLIVLSDEEKKFFKTNNVIVIPNPLLPLDHYIFKKSSEKENLAIFAGRLAPVKNLEFLINIWERIVSEKPSWKIKIFGEAKGEYYNKLKQVVQEKQLEDSFLFMGETSNLSTELSKAKVFLMTSLNECFPMVILEAFGMGIPVIANDCPTGPRNIIKNGFDGFLTKYNDIDDFVKTFNKFDEDVELQNQLSKQAIKTSQLYKIEIIMNMWNEKVFI